MSTCFLCLKQVPVPVSPPIISSRSGRGRGRDKNCQAKKNALSDQLTALFLVHKLLEIPLKECSKLLKEFGNPNDWIDLCSSCLPLVEWAKAVNDKIIAAQKELDGLKIRILAPLEVEVKVEVDDDGVIFNGVIEAAVAIRNKFYERRTRGRNNTHVDGDDGPVDLDPFADVDEFGLEFSPQQPEPISNVDVEEDDLEDGGVMDSDSDNYDPSLDDSGKDKDLKDWKTVVQEREIAVKALPKVSPNSSKEDRRKYRRQRDRLHLSKLASKHKISAFPCLQCDVVFDSFLKWKAHSGVNGVHAKYANGFKCEKCGKIVSHIVTLENHFRSFHCPNLNLHCNSCQKLFKKCNEYNKHAKKNEKCRKSSLRCTYCPTVMYLGNKECLDFHKEIRHLKKPLTPYKCSFCDRRFNYKMQRSKHELVHTDPNKSFVCDKCGQAFMYSDGLQIHIRVVHLSKEPGYEKQVCKICKAEFPSFSGLRRHEKLHKKDSPYLCTVCGKSFKIRNYLTIHMWSHDPTRKNNYYKSKPITRRGRRKRVEPVSISDSEGDDYTEQQNNLLSTSSSQNAGNEEQNSSDYANTEGCNPSSSNSVKIGS